MAMDTVALLDETVRHQIDLERYKLGQVKRILRFVRQMRADMIERLVDQAVGDNWQTARQRSIISQLDDIAAAAMARIDSGIRDAAQELTDAELQFQAQLLSDAFDVDLETAFDRVTVGTVYAAAASQPFRGAVLAEWSKGLDDGVRRRLRRELSQSFTEGETLRQAVSRISGVADMTDRQATALARTTLQHMASFAQRRAYQQASATQWIFIAVLDSRTTAECRGRSGKVYTIEDSAPWPPRHMQCRSTAMPIETRADIPEIPSYSDWLDRQPVEIQNDILGVKKAQLFRRGGLNLDRFIDRKGSELTLDELRRRYPGAWRRARLAA